MKESDCPRDAILSRVQFDRARRLALRLAGIELAERHRELLHRRSRRLGICDDSGIDSLLNAAEQGEPGATQKLLCLLTTKFTGFFRHPRHFDLAAEQAFVAVRQRGQARLWSAGAATGEEPYSLAMALIEVFQRPDPPVRILATDVDTNALTAAERGEYAERAMTALTQERCARFFILGDTGAAEANPSACVATTFQRRFNAPEGFGLRQSSAAFSSDYQRSKSACGLAQSKTLSRSASHLAPRHVTSDVRRLVEFRVLNLANACWPIAGPFDVILCRNVLMYLEARHRHAALERMAALLAPDGLLMLDPAEHLGSAGRLFAAGADGVYLRRRELQFACSGSASPAKLKS